MEINIGIFIATFLKLDFEKKEIQIKLTLCGYLICFAYQGGCTENANKSISKARVLQQSLETQFQSKNTFVKCYNLLKYQNNVKRKRIEMTFFTETWVKLNPHHPKIFCGTCKFG